MASCIRQKEAIPSTFDGIASCARYYSKLGKITKFAEGGIILGLVGRGPAHDEMVEHFNFQELPGPDQVTRHLDVRLAGRWVAGYAANGISGVIPQSVLCRM